MRVEGLKVHLEDLKLLLNRNRIEILRILRKRKYTASELAKLLNLSVPTVLYHLSLLESGGFVKKCDSERKWVYYELSEKGSKLLSGFLKIMLVSSVVAILLLARLLSPKETTQKPLGGGELPIFAIVAFAVLILTGYLIVKLTKSRGGP